VKAVAKYLEHWSTAVTADMYQHDDLTPEDGVLEFDGSRENRDA
jgi:hypothetical protein